MAPTRHTTQTETRAFASLFLGIAAFVLGPFAGIPAIALGSAARKGYAQSGSKSRGAFVAGAGTLIGFFGMGFFAVFTMYLGNAALGASAESAQLTAPQVVVETQAEAKVTAPKAPTRPTSHRDLEMMHSPR